MKGLLFKLSLSAALLCLSIVAVAQDRLDFDQSLITGNNGNTENVGNPEAPVDGERPLPAVESNFTLSFTLIGMELGYEQRLGRLFSMTARAGFHNAVTDGHHFDIQGEQTPNYEAYGPEKAISYSGFVGDINYFCICPTVSLEGRYYTSLDRRAGKGKKTAKNSANYLAFRTSGYAAMDKSDCKGIDLKGLYGLRRVYGSSFFLDFQFGLGYSTVTNYFYPALNLRLGFAI